MRPQTTCDLTADQPGQLWAWQGKRKKNYKTITPIN